MKNELTRRYRLSRWTLGLETLILFCLVDGLVVAYQAGITTAVESAAFLAAWLLISFSCLATVYLTESGRALTPLAAPAPVSAAKGGFSVRRAG